MVPPAEAGRHLCEQVRKLNRIERCQEYQSATTGFPQRNYILSWRTMRASDLLHPRPEGLYCPPGDFFIDPVRPVDRALITHGHSDHARSGHRSVLATQQTLDIMALRYGEDFAGTTQAAGLWRDDRPQRRQRQLPSGRPCAGLGADRGRASGHAHRRLRRLQAAQRCDLRAVRADALRRVHHRGDLRPAGVSPSARHAKRSPGC